MAEILGLVSSIITIAETGAKVATTLGKLSVKLKNAGKEAREISRKIKLVSKALKQIEVKLRDDQDSIDMSLVEEYVILCEERMEEAGRLVDVLESEMKSPSTWDRAKFRIRFILEKSTFTLLQQDLDSLHLTLDLYVTVLIHQQARKNETMLEEVLEKLAELKQEVEDDIQVRSASAAVTAALLTIQYNNFFCTNFPAASSSVSSARVVEDVTSHNGDHIFGNTEHPSDQSLSLFTSRGSPGSLDSSRLVPLDMLDDDMVSKVLVTFTQIQTLQKKTLRKVDFEFEKNSQSLDRHLPASVAVGKDHGDGRLDSVTSARTFETPNEESDSTGKGKRESLGIHRKQESTSSVSDGRTLTSVPGLAVPGENSSIDEPSQAVPFLPTHVAAVRMEQQEKRERLAEWYSDRTLLIALSVHKHIRSSRENVEFSRFKKSSLPDIILGTHMMYLSYDPPHPVSERSNDQAAAYLPPPIPTRESATARSELKPTSRLKSLFGPSTDKDTQAAYRLSIAAFIAYVVDYAQWYTDFCKLAALKNQEYLINLHRTATNEIPAFGKSNMSVDEAYDHLAPDTLVSITFVSKQLSPENMVKFRTRKGPNVMILDLVDNAVYSQDLRGICSLDSSSRILDTGLV